MSRTAHAHAVYDAYSALNIVHQKVTHAGRQNGRQLLEKAGVEKMSADVAGVVELERVVMAMDCHCHQ